MEGYMITQLPDEFLQDILDRKRVSPEAIKITEAFFDKYLKVLRQANRGFYRPWFATILTGLNIEEYDEEILFQLLLRSFFIKRNGKICVSSRLRDIEYFIASKLSGIPLEEISHERLIDILKKYVPNPNKKESDKK